MAPPEHDPLGASTADPELKQEIRATWVLRFMLGIGAIVIIGFAVNIPAALRADSNSETLVESERISGCRAAANVGVQDARGRLDDATAELDDSRAALEVIQSQGLDAVIRRDEPALEQLRAMAADAREKVQDDRSAVKSAREQLSAATAAYSTAVRESVENRDQFLADCTP